jgi:hypothetical protein
MVIHSVQEATPEEVDWIPLWTSNIANFSFTPPPSYFTRCQCTGLNFCVLLNAAMSFKSKALTAKDLFSRASKLEPSTFCEPALRCFL